MYPKISKSRLSNSKHQQRGSMLVIALFVIVVFGLLGLTMTRLLSSSSETVIYEVLGQRALNAARAGIECAIANATPGIVCAQAVSMSFNNVAGLENCSYTVVGPINRIITDGANTFTYSIFTSTGECTAGNIITSRTVYVDALL